MATKILRKLTIRDAIGGKAEILKAAQSGRSVSKDENGKDVFSKEGASVPLLLVLGQVRGFVAGEGDNGAFLKLKGSFEGTNLQTGEVIQNVGVAILPNFISDLLAGAMTDGVDAVDFGVKISVKYDEAAATMYVFEAESLMPAQESKAITGIKAQLAAAGIALPKPAATPLLSAPSEPAAAAPTAAQEQSKPQGKKK